MCYNCVMRKLYYATFEKGWDEVVKLLIKKQDKNSMVKKLYDDAVLFFADEHFKFENNGFKQSYLVIDNLQKDGVGALNAEMKHLLEKKGLKIAFPKEVGSFRLSFLKENDKVLIDANLKKAVEITLRKATKKSISYVANEAELVFLSKNDGTNLFMKKLFDSSKVSRFSTKYEMNLDEACLVNFLSEPAAAEVVLDPYAGTGVIAYSRALSYKKANVIANVDSKERGDTLKKYAKSLKDKSLSVLNYDFLAENFPIRFIDKIVTNLVDLTYERTFRANEFYAEFIDKLFELKVKVAVLVVSKSHDISRFVEGKFDIERQVIASKYNVYKIKIRG